jgi:hypothetical protein
MNIEKFKEYFNNRTYDGCYRSNMTYSEEAQETRINFLKDLEKRIAINIDDIIKDDEKILGLFKKIGGNNRSPEVSDLDFVEIASLTNALRHYYRAINGKSFPVLSIEELDS